VGKVAILPPIVQGQIAAGEVIERPASVVKELVENALDAGARHVEVSLREGGIDRIAVRDDGEGMAPDDALLAFARHGTSKLTTTEQLERVTTLGFRGEALPSIAAAGAVRLVTRRAEDPAGIAIEADGTGARVAGPAGSPPGTLVEVRELFATTPARRKFLRTTNTEVGHVVDLLTRLAVACPDTGFRLEHDGREVVAYPPVRGLRERLAQVLGAERAGSMIGSEAAAGGLALTAFLGPPRESLSTTRLVWTFVSLEPRPGEPSARRWVRDRLLLRAVLDGYESLLMRGRYPVAMLFLATAPGELDVNVHPAKLEVRFRRPQAVHQLIVSALRARLVAALGPAAAQPAGAVAEEPPRWGRAGPLRAEPLPAVQEPARSAPPAAGPFGPGDAQGLLWQPAPEGFASLRYVGQVLDGYLLCEGVDRVVLLDQHAAHERVRFERLRVEHAAGSVARDGLLVPETIALPPVQLAALVEHERTLAALGLEGEPFGDGTFLLRTVPRLLRGHDVGELVRALASELAEQGASLAGVRAVDAVLATLACHSAVRVGQRLGPEQVRALLEAMDSVDVNAHCPHGRPVAIELSRARLEALFGR
jgi:DNA mismatch repair protein MutL